MIILQRAYISILSLLYLVSVIFIFIWWFVPFIITGESHKQVLDRWFNYMYSYSTENKLFKKGE